MSGRRAGGVLYTNRPITCIGYGMSPSPNFALECECVSHRANPHDRYHCYGTPPQIQFPNTYESKMAFWTPFQGDGSCER
jgi:hypothetical protein